jgi:hypothetical protein
MGLGWSVADRDPATGKIEKAGRAHGDDYKLRVARKYLMCQLVYWLAFERGGKTLERQRVEGRGAELEGGKVKSPTLKTRVGHPRGRSSYDLSSVPFILLNNQCDRGGVRQRAGSGGHGDSVGARLSAGRRRWRRRLGVATAAATDCLQR